MVRRFFWALTARFTRAMGVPIVVRTSWLLRRCLLYGRRSAVQHLVDPLGVVARHGGTPLQPSRSGARLVLEHVPAIGLLTHDLPGSGAPESFRRPTVGLGLGHMSSVLLYQFGDGSVSLFGAGFAGWGVGQPACWAARARVFAPRCGANTIVMLRPSCLADVSTNP